MTTAVMSPEHIVSDELRFHAPAHSEQALIGGVMACGAPGMEAAYRALATSAVDLIEPSDFYIRDHIILWQGITGLLKAGEELAVETVWRAALEVDPRRMVSIEALLDAVAMTLTSVRASEVLPIARLIKRTSLKRRISVASQCDDMTRIAGCIAELQALDTLGVTTDTTVAGALDEYWDAIDIDEGRPVPLGYSRLDRTLGGLKPGELILVAARPSVGKSAFGINVAHHLAVRGNRPTAILSLEMSRAGIVQRLLAMESGLSTHLVRSQSALGDQDMQRVIDAIGRLRSAPLHIVEPASRLPAVLGMARSLAAAHGIELLILDYLQLMSTGRRTEGRVQEVGELSRSLKELARELSIPIMALAQLSRAAEQRDGPPKLSDLRESGSLEQDADVVLFLHPVAESDATRSTQPIDVIIAKHRNGPVGVERLEFVRHSTRFVEPQLTTWGRD